MGEAGRRGLLDLIFARKDEKPPEENSPTPLLSLKEDLPLIDGRSVPQGAPCGFLYRNFTTLHKYDRFFFVLDVRRGWLYEFEDKGQFTEAEGTIKTSVSLLSPRNVDSIVSARLEDELVRYKTSGGVLFCWKLFLKGEKEIRPKILNLGATSVDDANTWIAVLRPAVKGLDAGVNEDRDSSNRTQTLSPSGNGKRRTGFFDSDLQGTPDRMQSWKQDVVVSGEVFKINCHRMSTNAWLLSEALRAYIRRNGKEPAPELTGLYNTSQGSMLDLGDDVVTSISRGDILQACCTASALSKSTSQDDLQIAGNSQPKSHRILGVKAYKEVIKTSSSSSAWTGTGKALAKHVSAKMIGDALKNSSEFWDNRVEQSKLIVDQLNKLCAATDDNVGLWASPKLLAIRSENDIRLHRSSEGVLATFLISAPPGYVLERMLDAQAQYEWDPCMLKAKYLELARSADVVYFETRYRGLWYRRSFCCARFWLKLDDGSYLLVVTPSAHPSCPLESDTSFVRGRLFLTCILRPFDIDHCIATAMSKIDLRVPLLQQFNRWAEQSIVQSFAGLREASAF